MRDNLKIIKDFFYKIFTNKLLVIVYLLIVLIIVIVTLNEHEKQELEHFEEMKFKNKSLVYSDCKKKCAVKYKDDEDKIKVCKKYCKCKKTCSSQIKPKKCLKKCKTYKLNLARDDPRKLEKIKLKQEIKKQEKKNKREEEYEKQQELKKEKINNSNNKAKSFLMDIVNKYSSESEKLFLLNLSTSTNRFYKDFKNIFKY